MTAAQVRVDWHSEIWQCYPRSKSHIIPVLMPCPDGVPLDENLTAYRAKPTLNQYLVKMLAPKWLFQDKTSCLNCPLIPFQMASSGSRPGTAEGTTDD